MAEKKKRSVKDLVLKTLAESRGRPVSGEKLAAGAGVSRAAVWKAVRQLREEGYPITAATNRGYALADWPDGLSARGILPFLNHRKYSGAEKPIFVYQRVSSTNQIAKEKALEGAADGTVILAEEQTQARGRLGRTFFAPPRGGLYMSVILRPDFDMSKSLLVTTAASVAVNRAVFRVCGLETKIKWVNDVYLDGKKICGILTEGLTNFENRAIDAIIIGIGINLGIKKEDFPVEMRETAAALPGDVSINRLAAEVINQLFEILDDFEEGIHPKYLDEYRGLSMVIGKEVLVYKNPAAALAGSPLKAKAIDISDDGGLMVVYENGGAETLASGEISLRFAEP